MPQHHLTLPPALAPQLARFILVGGFALPLLADEARVEIAGTHLEWLDAVRAPVPGERGELMLWRDPVVNASTAAPVKGASNGEVAGMMRRWGYAQPGAR